MTEIKTNDFKKDFFWFFGLASTGVAAITFSWGDWFFKGLCIFAMLNLWAFPIIFKKKAQLIRFVQWANVALSVLVVVFGAVRFFILYTTEYRWKAAVLTRLQTVRTAEINYKNEFGSYTTNFNLLKLPVDMQNERIPYIIGFSGNCFIIPISPASTSKRFLRGSWISYSAETIRQLEDSVQNFKCPDPTGKEKLEIFAIADLGGPKLDIWMADQDGRRERIQDGRIPANQVPSINF